MAGGSDVPYPTATAMPIAHAAIQVEVIAPATLQAGYSFQAIYNGTTFTVTVPPDGPGVKEGERMTVPFDEQVPSPPPQAEAEAVFEWTPLTSPRTTDASTIIAAPRFKDGLCDCLTFGPCHPSFLNACCFPQLLMAQIMTRLKLNMCATTNADGGPEYKATFRRMVVVVIGYWIVSTLFAPPSPTFEVNEDDIMMIAVRRDDYPIWQYVLYHVVMTAFALYTLIILTRIRAAVRNRYQIPEQHCHGMEDCCCALFCGCCTVAQLARQTTDYHERRAVCCSDTGLTGMMMVPPAAILTPAITV